MTEEEGNSLSYIARKKFALYFSTIKRMRSNEKEKLFLMNGKISFEC